MNGRSEMSLACYCTILDKPYRLIFKPTGTNRFRSPESVRDEP